MVDAERFKGFHLDYMGTLEEAGEIGCEILKEGPLGTYLANIRPAGFYRAELNKTMYPKHWKVVDVLKGNREAILSAELDFRIDSMGTIGYNGVFENQLKIQSYIDKNGILTTTFPDFTKWKKT